MLFSTESSKGKSSKNPTKSAEDLGSFKTDDQVKRQKQLGSS